jgi:HTH-type transcriptional regulator, sugar sensing transcriptional regulator
MLKQIIENFDLTEKEAKVYLAGLKCGKSKVSTIAKEAGLNRITTYEILKRLAYRGLAGGITYDKLTYFQVVDPDTLINKRERQLNLAKNFLPNLLALKNSDGNRPKIDFFSGVEGIKTIYEKTLTTKKKIIYNITNIQNLTSVLDKSFLDDYFEKRTKRKIKVKVLLPQTGLEPQYLNDNEKLLREVKIFDSKKHNIPNEIMIFDDKVAMLSFSSKMGVIIEDSEMASSMLAIWQIMWEMLPEEK